MCPGESVIGGCEKSLPSNFARSAEAASLDLWLILAKFISSLQLIAAARLLQLRCERQHFSASAASSACVAAQVPLCMLGGGENQCPVVTLLSRLTSLG